MFEKRTEFRDSLFYDISAWTFPLAFNLDYTEAASMKNAGNKIEDLSMPSPELPEESDYAYLLNWKNYMAPKALNRSWKKRFALKWPWRIFSLDGKNYGYGTIMIPVQNQKLNKSELHQFLKKFSKIADVKISAIETGMTQGINLGSNQFRA